jgi:hypothetical protein
LELGDLLVLFLLVDVASFLGLRVLRVLFAEGQDGVHALGAEVGAADEPLVSLSGVRMSRALRGCCLLWVVGGSGC